MIIHKQILKTPNWENLIIFFIFDINDCGLWRMSWTMTPFCPNTMHGANVYILIARSELNCWGVDCSSDPPDGRPACVRNRLNLWSATVAHIGQGRSPGHFIFVMYASPVLFSCCIYYDRCESMAVDAFTFVLVLYCACMLSVLHVHIHRKVSVTRNLTSGTGIKVDCWCLRNRYGATSTQTLNKFIVFYTVSLLVFLLSFLLVICGFTSLF